MPLTLRNTRDLVSADKLRLKVLVYGFAGSGKTSWMASANAPESNRRLLAGVCETGHGSGLLSVAQAGFDYAELGSYSDFEEFCTGLPAKGYDVIGLDSLSWANKTFVKDKAL